jgi:hypothetical protein
MPTLPKGKHQRALTAKAPTSAREKAYRALQQKMLSGEFPAGSPISEASLARELGISRSPVREAIGPLIAQGLLRPVPNRGTVVLEFGKRDIAEIYDVREALELYAVGKAVEGPIRAAEVEELIRLADEMLELRDELQETGQSRLNAAQMQRFVASDLRYHDLLPPPRVQRAAGEGGRRRPSCSMRSQSGAGATTSFNWKGFTAPIAESSTQSLARMGPRPPVCWGSIFGRANRNDCRSMTTSSVKELCAAPPIPGRFRWCPP